MPVTVLPDTVVDCDRELQGEFNDGPGPLLQIEQSLPKGASDGSIIKYPFKSLLEVAC